MDQFIVKVFKVYGFLFALKIFSLILNTILNFGFIIYGNVVEILITIMFNSWRIGIKTMLITYFMITRMDNITA